MPLVQKPGSLNSSDELSNSPNQESMPELTTYVNLLLYRHSLQICLWMILGRRAFGTATGLLLQDIFHWMWAGLSHASHWEDLPLDLLLGEDNMGDSSFMQWQQSDEVNTRWYKIFSGFIFDFCSVDTFCPSCLGSPPCRMDNIEPYQTWGFELSEKLLFDKGE